MPAEELERVRAWGREGGTPYNRALNDLVAHIDALEHAAKVREHDLGKHRGYYEACRQAGDDYRNALATLLSVPQAEAVDAFRRLFDSLKRDTLEAVEPFVRHLRAFGDDPGPYRMSDATGYREMERSDLERLASLKRRLAGATAPEDKDG